MEAVTEKLMNDYRKAKRALLRLEKKQIDTPLAEQAAEIVELRGFVRGLLRGYKRALTILETGKNQKFPGFDTLGAVRPE